MSFKLPDLDKTDHQSVISWHTGMQDLWMITDDELSMILDESADLNTLKEKVVGVLRRMLRSSSV